VGHHYDVGNDFYRLVLGPSMTYSCARFTTPDASLEEAQAAKHELICRKLGLDRPPSGDRRRRLLDVGCGWGSMVVHAATSYDVDVVGVTISTEQATYARRRIEELGLADRVEIREQDYREVDDGPYDVVCSIGMAEHVGHRRMPTYFRRLYDLVAPGGRLLNHAIASVGGSRLGRRSFVNRYVFPDGELLDIAETVRTMEEAGFEVRDVENLREHYERTLRCWVANLERCWDAAVDLVGEARSRVWLMYMSGSVNGFEDGGLQIYQTLGVRLHDDGASNMPATRDGW
jgi:cyclopropane-fatty-acyl-phospholipid synthase